MESQKKSNTSIWIIVALVVLGALYGAYVYFKGSSTVTPTVTTNTPPVTTPTDVPTTYLYKDGQYSAVGDYNSPGGAEEINVSLTLKNDIITSATVTSLRASPTAVRYQGRFISGFQAQVIGRRLDQVVLSRVSGSSLTPNGWNDAIAKIQAQAVA